MSDIINQPIELKPCPFCGGEAVKKILPNGDTWIGGSWIECLECGAQMECEGHAFDTLEDNWNARVAAGDWISVKDKLPVEGKMVIAYMDNGDIEIMYRVGWFFKHRAYNTTIGLHGVTYWMPFPESPKEEI